MGCACLLLPVHDLLSMPADAFAAAASAAACAKELSAVDDASFAVTALSVCRTAASAAVSGTEHQQHRGALQCASVERCEAEEHCVARTTLSPAVSRS